MRLSLPTNPSPICPPAVNADDALAILLERTEQFLERLTKLETAVRCAAEQSTTQEWYSTAAAAKALGLAEFTVRNYCRLGRIRGVKRRSGRGKFCAWVISHEELERVRREGLIPLPRQRLA